MISDVDLVGPLRARQSDAWHALFSRYGLYVERIIVRTIGVDPEVPDLVNEVFVHALNGIESLRESSALKGWIGSIALFTARGFIRGRSTRRRWLRFVPPESLPELSTPAAPENQELFERTNVLLGKLPPPERHTLALRFVRGMRLNEIAKTTGVSLATVKRRIKRGERRLRVAALSDPLLRDHLVS